MLDFFLVLGQIPGTNFQITFSEMLVISAIFLASICYWLSNLEKTEKPRPLVWESLIRYELPDFKLPARPTHPKAGALPIDTWLPWLDRRWPIVR